MWYASAVNSLLGVVFFFLISYILSSEIGMLKWNLDVVDWCVQFREEFLSPEALVPGRSILLFLE